MPRGSNNSSWQAQQAIQPNFGSGPATVQGFHSFASNAAILLQNGMNVNALRTNNLLRKDEWVELDQVVVDVAKERLIAVEDLRSRNLVHPLGGLGTLFSEYEAQSDMTDATIDMSGVSPGEEDSTEWDLRAVPVPVIHKDFRIDIRRLEASRRLGNGVDFTQARVAARKVAEGAEKLVISGSGIKVDNKQIYGYRNHPNLISAAIATGKQWNSIANIYPGVLDMVSDAHGVNHYGPYILYVAKDVWPQLLAVYDDGSGQTARDRLLKIPQLEDVKPLDLLPDGEAVLVQMSRETVDLAIAQDLVTVEWNTMGGFVSHFKVLMVLTPRVKADYDGRLGVVRRTGVVNGNGDS